MWKIRYIFWKHASVTPLRIKILPPRALTHSSFSNENKARGVEVRCNERLEFLGDSVLSLIASVHLFKENHDLFEGDLTKIRAGVVCENALYDYAKEIGLGELLRLGRGEENTGGRNRKSILSDAFEAVIAAVYLDGGFAKSPKLCAAVCHKSGKRAHAERLDRGL